MWQAKGLERLTPHVCAVSLYIHVTRLLGWLKQTQRFNAYPKTDVNISFNKLFHTLLSQNNASHRDFQNMEFGLFLYQVTDMFQKQKTIFTSSAAE